MDLGWFVNDGLYLGFRMYEVWVVVVIFRIVWMLKRVDSDCDWYCGGYC